MQISGKIFDIRKRDMLPSSLFAGQIKIPQGKLGDLNM
jgi:hypothetical protein